MMKKTAQNLMQSMLLLLGPNAKLLNFSVRTTLAFQSNSSVMGLLIAWIPVTKKVVNPWSIAR